MYAPRKNSKGLNKIDADTERYEAKMEKFKKRLEVREKDITNLKKQFTLDGKENIFKNIRQSGLKSSGLRQMKLSRNSVIKRSRPVRGWESQQLKENTKVLHLDLDKPGWSEMEIKRSKDRLKMYKPQRRRHQEQQIENFMKQMYLKDKQLSDTTKNGNSKCIGEDVKNEYKYNYLQSKEWEKLQGGKTLKNWSTLNSNDLTEMRKIYKKKSHLKECDEEVLNSHMELLGYEMAETDMNVVGKKEEDVKVKTQKNKKGIRSKSNVETIVCTPPKTSDFEVIHNSKVLYGIPLRADNNLSGLTELRESFNIRNKIHGEPLRGFPYNYTKYNNSTGNTKLNKSTYSNDLKSTLNQENDSVIHKLQVKCNNMGKVENVSDLNAHHNFPPDIKNNVEYVKNRLDVLRNSRHNPGRHFQIMSHPPCDEISPTFNMMSPGSMETWETPYGQLTNLQNTPAGVSCAGPCYTFYKKATDHLPESSKLPQSLYLREPLKTAVPKIIPDHYSKVTAPTCNKDTCEKLLLKTPAARACTRDTCEKLLSRFKKPQQQQLKIQKEPEECIKDTGKKDHPVVMKCECTCKNAKDILKNVITNLANLTDLLSSTECTEEEIETPDYEPIEIPSVETMRDKYEHLDKCLTDATCEILCWGSIEVPHFERLYNEIPPLDICDLLCWKGYTPTVYIKEISPTVEEDKETCEFKPEISCTPLCWEYLVHPSASPDGVHVPPLVTCDLLCWDHDEVSEVSCSVLCWDPEIKSPLIPDSLSVPPLDTCDLLCWKRDEAPLEIEEPISTELILEPEKLKDESLEMLVTLVDSFESKEDDEELEIFESAIDVPEKIIYVIAEPEDIMIPPDKSEELVLETKVLPKKTVFVIRKSIEKHLPTKESEEIPELEKKYSVPESTLFVIRSSIKSLLPIEELKEISVESKELLPKDTVYTIMKSIENIIPKDESDITIIVETPPLSETMLYTVGASPESILSIEESEAIIIPELKDSVSDRTIFIMRKSIEKVLPTKEPEKIDVLETRTQRTVFRIRRSITMHLPTESSDIPSAGVSKDSISKSTIYIIKKPVEEILSVDTLREVTISDEEHTTPAEVVYIVRKSIETILPTEVPEIEESVPDFEEAEQIPEEPILDIKEILEEIISDIKEFEEVPILKPKIISDKRMIYSVTDMTKTILSLQETSELPKVEVDVKISSEHILPEIKSEDIPVSKLEITEDLPSEKIPSEISVSSLTWCEVLCWESMRPRVYCEEMTYVPVLEREEEVPSKTDTDTVPCKPCFCIKKAVSEPTVDKSMKEKPQFLAPGTNVHVSLITEVSITNESPQGTVTTVTKAKTFKETLPDKKSEESENDCESTCDTVTVISKTTVSVGKETAVEKESTVCNCECDTINSERQTQKEKELQYEEPPVSLVSQIYKVSAVKEPEIKVEKPVYLVTESRESLLSEDSSTAKEYVPEESIEPKKSAYLVKGQPKITESIEAQSLSSADLTESFPLTSLEACDILCWSKDRSEPNKTDDKGEDPPTSKTEEKKET